ncbi:MAG TPA: hypothetical protein VHP33_37635 [Polyangiaceae bacterium]|nr:hypothetical protein [Polyangiaceae bacterium]
MNRAGLWLAAVALAVACGQTERSPGPTPQAGGEAGEGGGGGTAPVNEGGSGGEGAAPPITAGAGGCSGIVLPLPSSEPPRTCKPCPKSLIWRPQNGGVLGSELKCASYRFQEAPCALELKCESDERIDVAEIAAALSEPDVNLGRQTYGRQENPTGDEPLVWQIWNSGGPIFVGPPCDGLKDCVDAPQAVLDLLSLLQALDAQEAYTSPDFCTAECPALVNLALLDAACARSGLVCSDVPECSGGAFTLVCQNDAWRVR